MSRVCAAVLCLASAGAFGQDAVEQAGADPAPMNPWSATLRYETVDYGPIEDSSVWAHVRYRLDAEWSLTGLLGYTDRSYTARSDVSGFEDARLGAEWRFWREREAGQSDRWAALRGGLEIPVGEDGLGSDSWDPYLGVVYGSARERLGWEVSAEYLLSTSDREASVRPGENEADLLTLGGGLVFRAWSDEQAAGDGSALYLVLDGLALLETNGDRELIVTPGVRWDGPRFAAEVGVSLPVVQDLDRRPEQDWGLILGFGLKF